MKLNINVPSLIKSLKDLDYAVFQNDLKPFNLNIVGIRSDNPIVKRLCYISPRSVPRHL